jgi:hypothetical protein
MKDELSDLRTLELPFDVDLVSPQCHACIRRHMKKYEKFIDKGGISAAGKFTVPCTGIPKDYIDPALKDTVDEDTWNTMLSSVDIVTWAEQYIKSANGKPWKARWYQSEVLRCNSRRKMLRIARRAGKTDLICIEICYYLFTEPGIKIVVAGPQKTHTQEIIGRVRNFIRSNPELSAMVVRDVSAPYYEIEVAHSKEKSRLRGFAAGSTGGKQGVSLRGQDADKLYLEEMDFIDENSITGAVLPILQTNANTDLIGFSTPSGFPTTYYEFCTQNPQYIEFHYDYKVLPHWKNVDMERWQYSEEKWTHEFLAEFGSAESGVYQPKYIQQALTLYRYSDCSPTPGWRYCIGTDWNEVHGAEIIVLGFNTFTGKFRLVEAVHVEHSEFTQLSSIEKLLEMNRKWKPLFVYIDSGNGSTNDELLRKTSYEHRTRQGGDPQTAKLLDTLKKYNSGSSIVVKDPVTREEHKTPAKPFMVNASIRMFEQHRIEVSSEDNVLKLQLENYMIKRYTPTKTPVYGLKDEKVLDHRLDALNLAIVAFHLEFDDLYKTDFITTAVAAVDPRMANSNRVKIGIDGQVHAPESRRIDDNNSIMSHIITPGRIDRTIIKTNRPGFLNDTEEQRMLEYQQRQRARRVRAGQRPSRTTF